MLIIGLSFIIRQPYIPPTNVDSSDIMSSDKLDKAVNVFKPEEKPVDHNQTGVKINICISDYTIICAVVVLFLVAVMYMMKLVHSLYE